MAKLPRIAIRPDWLRRALEPSVWDVGNDWLYELCRKYPGHEQLEHVAAKVWLIGRAYAVAAERGVAGEGKGEEFLVNKLLPRIRRSDIDEWFSALPRAGADYRKHLPAVVGLHKRVEDLFAGAADHALGRVSLVSKYLHFHRADLFPIIDSRATKAIAQIAPDDRHSGYRDRCLGGEEKYSKFCARAAWLSDRMEERVGRRVTLRELDRLLLCVYEDECK